MSPKLLRALFALCLCSPVAAQDPADDPQEGTGTDELPPLESSEVGVVSEMDKLIHIYFRMHGGRARMQDLRTLAFEMVPYRIEDNSEQEQPPVHVEVILKGKDRAIRLEEELDGRKYVKLSDAVNTRVWVDGTEREIPELIQATRQETKYLYMLLDLLYRPDAADFKGRFAGIRKRGGVEYASADFEFHPSRNITGVFRAYFNMKSGMVDRIDVHDTNLPGNRRVGSYYFSDYVQIGPEGQVVEEPEFEDFKFPTQIEHRNRDGERLWIWRFHGVEVDPELALDQFKL